ncbi:hypothetical protein RhiJN_21720 [Ceratobasidium sp. AG-Ba]|nr:hypothetical protein RhiJN_21720 [Ceratobasidium sp. AG-Ba]
MFTFYAYTFDSQYLREAAEVNGFTWAHGPYGDLEMAIKYYEHLKPYGSVRLKRVLVNHESGWALVVGKNDTALDSLPNGLKKRLWKLYGCRPHLYTSIPGTHTYTSWLAPEEDIDGKGYELRMTSVGTIKYNIPLADGEER